MDQTDTQNCENEPPLEPEDRDRDTSFVHPDGRPIYLQPVLWAALQRMRAASDHDHAAPYRSMYLFYQAGRRDGRWIGPASPPPTLPCPPPRHKPFSLSEGGKVPDEGG